MPASTKPQSGRNKPSNSDTESEVIQHKDDVVDKSRSEMAEIEAVAGGGISGIAKKTAKVRHEKQIGKNTQIPKAYLPLRNEREPLLLR